MKAWKLLLPAALAATGCEGLEPAGRPADLPVAVLPAPSQPGVVSITPDTARIEFTGSTSLMSQSGHFAAFAGTLEMPSDDVREARLTATVDMTSTTTHIGLLTKHLKAEDFFDVAKYPSAQFASTCITPTGERGRVVVSGRLTFHGVTKEVEFPAKLEVTPAEVSFEGTIPVRQTQFGMTESAQKTKDEVPVMVTFRGRRR